MEKGIHSNSSTMWGPTPSYIYRLRWFLVVLVFSRLVSYFLFDINNKCHKNKPFLSNDQTTIGGENVIFRTDNAIDF